MFSHFHFQMDEFVHILDENQMKVVEKIYLSYYFYTNLEDCLFPCLHFREL